MMIMDKYLHSSALQKSIRRGEEERAINAATSLWQLDNQTFWRRLHIIALEDIGVGNSDAVINTLLVAASSQQRKDMQLAMHLISLLCAGAKNRLADSIFVQAERSAQYADLREQLSVASNNALADYALEKEKPLVGRAIAIWLLAGTKKYPSDFMPKREGSLDKAISVVQALSIPEALTAACIAVTKLTRWPLSLFIPLIWQEAQKHPVQVVDHDLPDVPSVGNFPLYCADGFTRLGRTCFSHLRKNVAELKPYTIQQIGLGVFYMEGGRVNNELTSPQLDGLQQAGEALDFASTGLSAHEVQNLRNCLSLNFDLLADIRQEHLQRYINAIQGKPTFTHSDVNGGGA